MAGPNIDADAILAEWMTGKVILFPPSSCPFYFFDPFPFLLPSPVTKKHKWLGGVEAILVERQGNFQFLSLHSFSFFWLLVASFSLLLSQRDIHEDIYIHKEMYMSQRDIHVTKRYTSQRDIYFSCLKEIYMAVWCRSHFCGVDELQDSLFF